MPPPAEPAGRATHPAARPAARPRLLAPRPARCRAHRFEPPLAGAAGVLGLFAVASIPLMEVRSATRRHGWERYTAETAVLVPLNPALLIRMLPGLTPPVRKDE